MKFNIIKVRHIILMPILLFLFFNLISTKISIKTSIDAEKVIDIELRDNSEHLSSYDSPITLSASNTSDEKVYVNVWWIIVTLLLVLLAEIAYIYLYKKYHNKFIKAKTTILPLVIVVLPKGALIYIIVLTIGIIIATSYILFNIHSINNKAKIEDRNPKSVQKPSPIKSRLKTRA